MPGIILWQAGNRQTKFITNRKLANDKAAANYRAFWSTERPFAWNFGRIAKRSRPLIVKRSILGSVACFHRTCNSGNSKQVALFKIKCKSRRLECAIRKVFIDQKNANPGLGKSVCGANSGRQMARKSL